LSEAKAQIVNHQHANDIVKKNIDPEIVGDVIPRNQASLQSSQKKVIKANPVLDEREEIKGLN
jgi:hypothetical protein